MRWMTWRAAYARPYLIRGEQRLVRREDPLVEPLEVAAQVELVILLCFFGDSKMERWLVLQGHARFSSSARVMLETKEAV